MKTETTALKLLRIEAEFNSPFESVVRSFAEAEHSMTDTARILDLSHKVFIPLIRAMGWDSWFVTGSQSVANKDREYVVTPLREKALREALNTRWRKFAFVYEGRLNTTAGHARRLGISYKAMVLRKEKYLQRTQAH